MELLLRARCCSRRAQFGDPQERNACVGTANGGTTSGEDRTVRFPGTRRSRGWRQIAVAIKKLLAANRAFNRLGNHLKDSRADRSARAAELRKRWSALGSRLNIWKQYRMKQRGMLEKEEMHEQEIEEVYGLGRMTNECWPPEEEEWPQYGAGGAGVDEPWQLVDED